MLSRSQRIPEASLRNLHPNAIDEPSDILTLLEAAERHRLLFFRGLDAHIDLEVARLTCVDRESLLFESDNFEDHHGSQVFLNFELDGRPYFFSTRPLDRLRYGSLRVELPRAA
jgi:hypothetical protein